MQSGRYKNVKTKNYNTTFTPKSDRDRWREVSTKGLDWENVGVFDS